MQNSIKSWLIESLNVNRRHSMIKLTKQTSKKNLILLTEKLEVTEDESAIEVCGPYGISFS